MKRLTLKAVGVAAVAALILSACGGGGSAPKSATGALETGPVTINFTWWGNVDRADR